MNSQRHKFHSIPLRTRRPAQTQASGYVRTRHTAMPQAIAESEEDEFLEDDRVSQRQVTPRSSRYVPIANTSTTRAIEQDQYGRQVITEGNRRLVFVKEGKPKARMHWLLFFGLGMVAMVIVVTSLILLGHWWDDHQLDATYGFPRTWQIDENVGHGKGESHFLFENLNGHIFFEEIPDETDFAHARIYPVTTLFGTNAASYPVTASFEDVNGDSHADMKVHIGDQTIIFLNTGNSWKPEQ